jgi:hypothetical protein
VRPDSRLNQKDLGAGLMFVTFGALGISLSDRDFGALGNMGPGYYPTIVSVLLVLLGLFLSAAALRGNGEKIVWGAMRPAVAIIAAVVAFALLIEPAGYAVATLVLVAFVYLGGWSIRPVEFLVLYAVLLLGSFLLFAKALNMPLALFPGA